MSEWHLTPEYINEHWTEELFALMFKARKDRFAMQAEIRAERQESDRLGSSGQLDSAEFFSKHNFAVREVN